MLSTTATTTRATRSSTAITTAAGTATCSAAAGTLRATSITSPIRSRRGRWWSPTAVRPSAVEVVDQEGLFNVYQERIRAKVRADGYRLSNVFISATHDESAPDSMGLGGVSQTTSGVNNYWASYLVDQAAKAIERAYRAQRARDHPLHRGARAVERPPVLVLVPVRRRPAHTRPPGRRRPRPNDRDTGQRQPARGDAWLQRRHVGARRPEQLGFRGLDQLLPQLAAAATRRGGDRDGRFGGLGRESGGVSVGDFADPAAVHRRQPSGRMPHAVQHPTRARHGRRVPRPARLLRRDEGVRHRHGAADHPGAQVRRVPQLADQHDLGRARQHLRQAPERAVRARRRGRGVRPAPGLQR